jgi:WD40 repeat protein
VIGSASVRSLAYTPDGGAFVAGYGSGRVVFYAAGSGARTRGWQAHVDAVVELGFTPDGRTLATLARLGAESEVKLWDAASGELIRTLPSSFFVFTPDGQRLALWNRGVARLVEVASGDEVWRRNVPMPGPVFFDATATRLFVGSTVLNASDGTPVGEFNWPMVVAVSRDRTLMVTIDYHRLSPEAERREALGILELRRIDTGEALWRVRHEDPNWGGFESLAFSPDDSLLAFTPRRGVGSILRVRDGHLVRALEEGARVATISPDGRHVAFGTAEGALQVWDLATGEVRLREAPEPGPTAPVVRVAASADGKWLASVTGGPTAFTVWRVNDRALQFASPVRTWRDALPESIALEPVRGWVARRSEQRGHVQVLAAPAGDVVTEISVGGSEARTPTAFVFLAGGSVLAVADNAGASAENEEPALISLFRTEDGRRDGGLTHPRGGFVRGLAVSSDGTWLAARVSRGSLTGGVDYLALWRASDRRLSRTVDLPWSSETIDAGWQAGLAFSSDGRHIATTTPELALVVSADGTIERQFSLERPADVAFSPNGQLLAVASASGLRVWDRRTWTSFGQVAGRFQAVTFLPDGGTLVGGAEDGTIRLYCEIGHPLR